MTEQKFKTFVDKIDAFQSRSMFGGTGLFKDEAMFALISGDKVFWRGGGELDHSYGKLGCEKYRHVKKQSTATVNYYDVTTLFLNRDPRLINLVKQSIHFSVHQRNHKKSVTRLRLRDLPNMQLTLERMVKKAGIADVDTFKRLGAPAVYRRVRQTYGTDIDLKVLWKFAGAIEGIHWELIQEPKKRQLLEQCR